MKKIFIRLVACVFLITQSISIYAQLGNDCSDAIPYEINSGTVGGAIAAPQTYWYTFTLAADYQNVLITICNSTIATGKLELHPDCGGTYLTSGEMCDQANGNYNEKISLSELDAGTYYVSVEAPMGPDNTGAYTFEITGTTDAVFNDLAVSEIQKPVKNFNETVPLTVTIKNSGVTSQTGFSVSYTFEGNTITETVPAALAGGDSVDYTFTQTLDLSSEDIYPLTAKTALVGDENTSNDESQITINTHQNSHVLSFDGSNDYVRIENNTNIDLTTNYTIEVWIKPESFNWLGGIVSKYHSAAANGYFLRLSSTEPYTGLSFDQMETDNDILSAGQWHHVAAINDNGTRKLYLDGVEQTLSGTALNVQSNTDPVCIGKDFLADSERYFNGSIDEVRIWNDVRTEQEIIDNMDTEIDPQSENLAAYYNFNRGIEQGDNTTIEYLPDITTNNSHGVLKNFALTSGTGSNFYPSCGLDFENPVPDLTTLPELGSQCSVTVTETPTATDNCAGSVTASTNDPLEYTEQGNYTITWTYDDENGNTVAQTQTIVVRDVSDPVISCVENQSIDLAVGETSYIVSGTEFDPLSTSDNCNVANVENNFNDLSTLDAAEIPTGTTTIIWTVGDDAGNQSSCSFDITVNKAPVHVNIPLNNGIIIYPNPAKDYLEIDFSGNPIQQINLLDITGKIIWQKSVIQPKERIDLSHIQKGIYTLSVFTGQEIYTHKIIKN